MTGSSKLHPSLQTTAASAGEHLRAQIAALRRRLLQLEVVADESLFAAGVPEVRALWLSGEIQASEAWELTDGIFRRLDLVLEIWAQTLSGDTAQGHARSLGKPGAEPAKPRHCNGSECEAHCTCSDACRPSCTAAMDALWSSVRGAAHGHLIASGLNGKLREVAALFKALQREQALFYHDCMQRRVLTGESMAKGCRSGPLQLYEGPGTATSSRSGRCQRLDVSQCSQAPVAFPATEWHALLERPASFDSQPSEMQGEELRAPNGPFGEAKLAEPSLDRLSFKGPGTKSGNSIFLHGGCGAYGLVAEEADTSDRVGRPKEREGLREHHVEASKGFRKAVREVVKSLAEVHMVFVGMLLVDTEACSIKSDPSG